MKANDETILRVGLTSSIATMDPRTAGDSNTSFVLRQIYESPFQLVSVHASPEPRVFAEPLEKLDGQGAKEWRGTVREGLKFSDGTELTPEIALRSLQKTAVVTAIALMELKNGKVEFHLELPYPRFDLLLSQTYAGIVHDSALKVVGTGPFMFEPGTTLRELQNQKTIRLVRNPHHERNVALDGIVFKIYAPDQQGRSTALVEALQAQEIDFAIGLTSADVGKLDLASYHPAIHPGNSTGFLFINTEKPALANVELRRAFAYLIDPSGVAERSYEKNPLAYVGRSILPPVMSRDPALFQYNKRKADELFARDDVKKPETLRLITPWAPRPYAPDPRAMGEELKEQFAGFGIEIKIDEASSSETFLDRLARSDYDLAMAGWIADTPDPADFFDALLHSKSILRPGASTSQSVNLARWSDSRTDAALQQYREDPSEENKKVILDEVAKSVMIIPLLTSQNITVHSRKVRNFIPAPAGDIFLGRIDLDK